MSRHGYSDDYEHMALYRNAVERALAGARGQMFLRDLVAALEAMPERRLVHGFVPDRKPEEPEYALEHEEGCCGLGALARFRNLDTSQIDATDRQALGKAFGIAESLAAEAMFVNDDGAPSAPEGRWTYVHAWAQRHIAPQA